MASEQGYSFDRGVEDSLTQLLPMGIVLRDRWLLRAVSQCQQRSDAVQHLPCTVCHVSWPAALLWPETPSGLNRADAPLAFCPPCCQVVQRLPPFSGHALQAPYCVLLHGLATGGKLPCVNDLLSSAFKENLDSELLKEVELELGDCRRALHLTFASEKSMRRALRVAVPGCIVDYLPPFPQQHLRVSIKPASNRDSLPAPEIVKSFLESSGRLQITCLEVDSSTHSYTAEASSVEAWYRVLALNGGLLDGVIVKVSPFPCVAASVEPLEVQQMSSFVRVPEDIPTLSEAVAQGACKIQLASGVYHLPHGLSLQRSVELIGDGDAELVLGAPVLIRTDQGALLRNLTFRASPDQSAALPALLRIHGSYTEVLGKSYDPLSRSASIFATCTWGQAAVILERCKFVGGHHGIDVRGWSGLRVRAGRDRRHDCDFDFGAWISRCHARLKSQQLGECLSFKVQQRADPIPYPKWLAIHGTCVHLVDCEICGGVNEAVHVWRGAHLKMARSSVHHCGVGIGVSHSIQETAYSKIAIDQSLEGSDDMSFSKAAILDITDCKFEDINAFDYSAAVSIGSFLPQCCDATDSGNLTVDAELLHTDGSELKPIHATLLRNEVARCSLGFICSGVRVQATENTLREIYLGAWRLCDTIADMQKNNVFGCGGVAVAVHSSAGEQFHGFNGIIQSSQFTECGMGIRLTAEGRFCKLRIHKSSFEGCGDGIGVFSAGCMAELQNCIVHKSIRCAVRISRGARAKLDGCQITSNGRGIIVAARSKATVRECHFDDNVGWAVRLDDDKATTPNKESEKGDAQTDLNGCENSVISDNVFGNTTRGKVGQKRIRIDTWHEGRFHAEGNQGADDGNEVQAVRKKVRILQEEQANLLATAFWSLSMAD